MTHCRDGSVETVAVHDNDDGSVLLATASSTCDGPSPICIWHWNAANTMKKRTEVPGEWGVMQLIEILIKIIMITAAGVYFLGIARQKFTGRLPSALSFLTPKAKNDEGFDVHEYIRQAMVAEMNNIHNEKGTQKFDDRKVADTAGTAGAHWSSPSESLHQATPEVSFAVTPASMHHSNPGVGIAVTETSHLEWCDEDAGLGCQHSKELHGDKCTVT
ncbi:hypothetical protein L208DRAFT_1378120 [Tricholoma matsutake]|nr:hypothetical protein L208DRAFT_1378120 [Tricholoma matsutake 945]